MKPEGSFAMAIGGLLEPDGVPFDRYHVKRRLGEGGMGTVWLVRHAEFDSDRALKVIAPGIATDQHAWVRFLNEVKIVDRLNHPNAVRVFDAGSNVDKAFIEMEYIPGESLNRRLVPGIPMPLDLVVDLLPQLCDVLQAASDAGVIHGTLKPTKLMLVDDRLRGKTVLKLLGFGIARILQRGDELRRLTGSVMGTPLYMSPEQITGDRGDTRSDIYAVGIILYELLTGHRPFEGSINAIIYRQTTAPPPPFAKVNPEVRVSPAVEGLVMKCLAKEPGERPQSPRALAAMFAEALASPSPAPRSVPRGALADAGSGVLRLLSSAWQWFMARWSDRS
jgi:serine/threonine-protein kinase